MLYSDYILLTPSTTSIYFLKFACLALVALGLLCCMQAFSSCGKQELLRELREAGATPGVAGSRSYSGWQCVGSSCSGPQALRAQASAVAACGLRCSVAHGIFPGQGSNPCPLQWQADS